MIREVDIDEISDGKRYGLNDMVKIECSDCKGCSECCHFVDDTIILDPYDIFMLEKTTGKGFEEMIGNKIDLKVVNGLIVPHIKIQEETGACGFLSSEGRCTIHNYRPGFCRLFPMGRIYENGGFSYFLQVNQCPYPYKNKVKLKKWLGIENVGAYEKFVLDYHDLYTKVQKGFTEDTSEASVKSINMLFLNTFFSKPYDTEGDFYVQFEARKKTFEGVLQV